MVDADSELKSANFKNRKLNAVLPMSSENSKKNLGLYKDKKNVNNSENDSKILIVQENGESKALCVIATENEEKNVEIYKKQRGNSVFRSIIIVALIIGLPVPLSTIFSKRCRAKIFLQVWNYSIFSIRTIFIIIECVYNHLLWPSLALRYSYLIHCLTGYAMVLIYLYKSREFEVALMKITRLSLVLRLDTSNKKPLVRIYTLVCFMCFVSFFALGAYFFFYTIWEVSFEKIASLSFLPEDCALIYAYNWLVMFAVVTSYHMSSATLFTTSLLCGHTYLAFGEFLKLFGAKLSKDMSKGPLTYTAVSRNIGLFKDIFRGTKAVDRALNVPAFVVYTAVVNGTYILLSIVLSNEKKYRTAEVQSIIWMIGLASTLKFFFLTLSGDGLKSQHVNLQNDLVKMSDSVVKRSSTLGIHMFSLLAANIRTTNLEVTGLGYFNITRLIIPSVISVITTYGWLLYQIGATKDLEP